MRLAGGTTPAKEGHMEEKMKDEMEHAIFVLML